MTAAQDAAINPVKVYYDYQRSQALMEVLAEFERATLINGSFHSAHEAYAIMLEEVDELWDEVKKNSSKRDYNNMRLEAVQIAAVALRFLVDITPVPLEDGVADDSSESR
jgi:hypothetical protein